jgi:hypothetical protein
MQNETSNPAPRNVNEATLEREPFKSYANDALIVDGPATFERAPTPLAHDHALVAAAPAPLIGALSDREFLTQFMDRPEQRALIPHREREAAEIFGFFSAFDIAAGVAAALVVIGPLAVGAFGG